MISVSLAPNRWNLFTFVLAWMLASALHGQSIQPSQTGENPPEWAETYLEDPLAEVANPSLEELRRGLDDPSRALTTLRLHFARATTLTRDEQLGLLRKALNHPQIEVRQDAALQLDRLGLLEPTVVRLLRDFAVGQDSKRKAAGLRGLAKLPPQSIPRDLDYIQELVTALSDPDIATAEASASQLVALGPTAVPLLIDALDDPKIRNAAAEVLGSITRNSNQRFSQKSPARSFGGLQPTGGADQRPTFAPVPMMIGPETIAKSRSAEPLSTMSTPTTDLQVVRQVAPAQQGQTVRVYYGTNRGIAAEPQLSVRSIVGPTTALVALILLSIGVISRHFTPKESRAEHHLLRTFVLSLLTILIAIWLVKNLNEAAQAQYSQRQGVRFAGHRSDNSTTFYGYCDVSIPPNHEVGQVESPMFGPEDEAKHVVLKEVSLVEEEAYFSMLRARLTELNSEDGCFVFIHGYNVSFDDAAKRTAQIFYDLDFHGLPIFYSWPSRASLRHYFSDRNEVLFSRELIKKFLVQVAEKSGAKKINVIAHSMGADAVTQAIASIEDPSIVFDQIILAAPDIDADTFKQQLLPRLQEHGRRTTLYCSKNDLALHMSFHFNDSWRAGDSSRGLLIADGLDTVDASMIDTELLGHSYYGSCLPLLKDFRELILYNRPPQQRNLVTLPSIDPTLPAWTFPQFDRNRIDDVPR